MTVVPTMKFGIGAPVRRVADVDGKGVGHVGDLHPRP